MKNKPLLALLPLFLLLTACSEFSGSEPPAPVATPVPPKKPAPKKPIAKKAQPAPPVAKKAAPGKGTATYALDAAPSDFKVEPSLPAFRAEPLVPPVDAPAPATSPAAPQTPGTAVAPAVPAPVPAPLSIVTEEAAIPSGTSPAVVALVSEADRNRNSGELDAAVVVMERALRIDSRNPTLTYKLAQLRLKQNKPQMAEELAGKAALLAGSDLDLKRKSWLLIAESRQLQHNYQGAKEAKIKAESFFGR